MSISTFLLKYIKNWVLLYFHSSKIEKAVLLLLLPRVIFYYTYLYFYSSSWSVYFAHHCCFVGWVFSNSYILSLLEIKNIFDHDAALSSIWILAFAFALQFFLLNDLKTRMDCKDVREQWNHV